MKIFIRTDASDNIGTGHVIRCLTLADELRRNDANISFICRDETGNLIKLIERKDYKVHPLPPGIDLETDKKLTLEILKKNPTHTDWLIVDHYEIDTVWESSLRNFVKKIMVIDDMANRPHDCDLLLDQNYNETPNRYQRLVPNTCTQLLGPKYALLRPQFSKAREKVRNRTGEVKRILVFMGGADQTNQTTKVLRAIKMLGRSDIAIDVVIGVSNAYRNEVEREASRIPNTTCHFNVEDIDELMVAADLSIGTSGTTTWERCCVGLPSVVITVAENQVEVAKQLANENYVINSGWYEDINEQDLLGDLKFLLRHEEMILQIACNVKKLVDGQGLKRVVNYLINNLGSIHLRKAIQDDCHKVFEWRNHPEIRRNFFDPSPLSWTEHQQWFLKAISSANVALLIGKSQDNPVGVLRYDFKGEQATVSIYVIPGFSGRRIGIQMLQVGSNWIKKNYPKVKKIIAEIKKDNIASVRAFQKAGFEKSHVTYVFQIRSDSFSL